MMAIVNTLPLCEHYPVHLGGNAGDSNFYNLDFNAGSDLLVAIGETADTGIKGTNYISGIVGMISAY
jgi:aspartate oxidase